MKSLIILIAICSFAIISKAQDHDKKLIEKTIVESYIKGLIDAEDFNKAKEGIHEDFTILGYKDTLLTKKTRDEWIAQRSMRMGLQKVEYKIEFIDIDGDAASSKIVFSRGNIKAIDYVLLYKFNEKWRIVSAIDNVKREQ